MDLITLNEYKTLLGVSLTNTRDDDKINAMIPAASRAVEKFVDRNFSPASAPEPRTFQYDGGEVVDVDDFVDITSITTDGGWTNGPTYTLDTDEYTAMPHRDQATDDPNYYIVLHSRAGSYSPEMGFARNLDTLPYEQRPVLLTVTATWGWPSVPSDVKLAVAWTIQDSIAKPASSDLQSESISGYSRSWQAAAVGQMLAVPNRARDLLSNYERVF